jgi:hypothetical protein
LFDSDNQPLLAQNLSELPLPPSEEMTSVVEDENQPQAQDLKSDFLREIEVLYDSASAEGMSYNVAFQGLKALKKANKSNDKINFFVTIYQSTMKQHKRRGQILVNPAALQRRSGASRSRKAQERGRPRKGDGRVMKRSKIKRNLAAAVAANTANASSH